MLDLHSNKKISTLKQDMKFFFMDKERSEKKTELELSRLNPEELEFMKIYDRRKALEDAGLNPDKYDF